MKVVAINIKPNSNYDEASFAVVVDGDVMVKAGGGEPEDNTIYRDLNFVFDIPDMLRAAYDAGRAGEYFVIENATLTIEEFLNEYY